MAKTDDIALSLGIEFKAAQFQKAYETTFKKMEKSAKRSSKEGQGAIGGFMDKVAAKYLKMPKMVKHAEKAIKDYNKQQKVGLQQYKIQYKEQLKAQKQLTQHIADLKALGDAATDADKKVVESSKAAVDAFKQRADAAKAFYAEAKKGAEELHEKVEDMEMSFNGEEMKKAAAEAGQELAEPFQALLNKDLPGAAKSGAKLLGKGFEGVFKGIGWAVGKGTGKAGGAIKAKGEKMAAGGGLGKMMGPMVKGFGGLVEKLGPMIQMFGKIGPLLGTFGGAIVGLVKLFLDADAAVKEWNKDMVASGGINQYFGKKLNDAGIATDQARGTMDKFRKAAMGVGADLTDLSALNDNLDWGIGMDVHKEAINNLQAEGVSLKTLGADYGQLVEQSSAYTDSVAAVTQASLAWSRIMGVSLTEITGFQAEMMTEMGMSLGSTTESFRMMSRAASESGIASNKFFATIRGVSADLNLYNTRMEDAVRLLGKLGKAMSPRNAQKFMQWSMNAVKGMSNVQAMQAVILAGPEKVAKMVERDIADKGKTIGAEIAKATQGDAAEITDLLTSGKKADLQKVRRMIGGIKDETKKGKLMEATTMLGLEKKRSKKGLYGLGQAAGQMSPVRQAAVLKSAIERFGEIGDIGAGQMAENLGVSKETLEQMEMFKDSMDDQRDELVKQAKAAGGTLKIGDKELSVAEIQKLDMDQIYDTLTDQEKAALEKAKKEGEDRGKEEQAAKAMGTHVQSIMDKLQVLLDWFMGTFYELVMDIMEILANAPILGSAAAREKLTKRAEEKKINRSTEAGKAYKEAGGDKYKMRDKLLMGEGSWGDKSKKGFEATSKEITSLTEALKTVKDADEKKAIESRLKEVTAKRKEMKDVISKNYLRQGTDPTNQAYKSLSMIKGPQEETAKKIMALMNQGKKSGEALQEVMKGKSDEEQMAFSNELFSKELWGMDPTDLAGVMADMPQPDDIGASIYDQFPDLQKFAKAGTTNSTIYTHDTHAEDMLKDAPKEHADLMAAAMAKFGSPDDIGAAAFSEALGIDPEAEEEMQKTQAGSLAELVDLLSIRGIRLNKSWMNNHMKKMVAEATLESLRTALLEFILMQEAGPEAIVQALQRGVDPKKIGEGLVSAAKDKGQAPGEAIAEMNAKGGLVTGVSNGLARVRAAAGEGLASVGKGERIIPAGGGGGGKVQVELSLKGDLAALIEAKAQETIVKHQAASKFR